MSGGGGAGESTSDRSDLTGGPSHGGRRVAVRAGGEALAAQHLQAPVEIAAPRPPRIPQRVALAREGSHPGRVFEAPRALSREDDGAEARVQRQRE